MPTGTIRVPTDQPLASTADALLHAAFAAKLAADASVANDPGARLASVLEQAGMAEPLRWAYSLRPELLPDAPLTCSRTMASRIRQYLSRRSNHVD